MGEKGRDLIDGSTIIDQVNSPVFTALKVLGLRLGSRGLDPISDLKP